MCRKSKIHCVGLIYLISFILVLGLVQTSVGQDVDTNLVGWWKFDGDALDSSGNGRNGTLQGNAQFVPGLFNEALALGGTGDYVSIDGYKGVLGTHAFSITAWIKTSGNGEIVGWGNNAARERIEFRISENRLRVEQGAGNRQGRTFVSDNEWHHVALTVVENATISYSEVILYLDGEDDTISGTSANVFNLVANYDVKIGRQYAWSNRWFIGLIDDVRIYDRVLSAAEIQSVAVRYAAYNPSPADGAESWTQPLFQWTAGETATWHDVYFGTNPTPGQAEFRGRQPFSMNMYFHMPGLAPGTTYYWRIDEIEADGTIHTGEVWSFSTPPLPAHSPDPGDGRRFMDTDAVLSWGAGFTTITHDVYFGTDENAVANGTGGTFIANQLFTTYAPGTLLNNTTYYWRIDEVEADGTTKHTGDLWRFRTKPEILIRDPNLVGWWKLDDVGSGTVIDFSGYNRDGTLRGDPQWVAGFEGDALEFDGLIDWVNIDGYKGVLGTHAFSITAWIKTTDSDGEIVGWGSGGTGSRVEFRVQSNRLRCESGGGNVQGDTNVNDDEWHHVALTVIEGATISSGDVTFYLDGQDDTRQSTDTDSFNITANFDVKMAQNYDEESSRWFSGLIDDARIYDVALTQEGILDAMAGDPALVRNPYPADESTVDIERATPLSWLPGVTAAKHDIYLGTDEFAVDTADTTTAGIYRGRQDANSYTPPEALEMGQTYYWRIDEVEADLTTIHTGRLWSFTVAEYLIVDDMESYTDEVGNRIFQTWIDGWGYTEPAPGNLGNGTGSTVGNLEPPFAEQTIVNSGIQSMPFDYNNVISPFYSETDRTFDVPQDWTRHDVKSLTLWFRGLIASIGSFAPKGQAPDPPVYTIIARGSDIWDTSDEFHYAYKRLSGEGSIVAKVLGVKITHGWAKAGVMIRDTLAPDSAHAAVYVTPSNGVAFERRLTMGDITSRDNQTGITAPHWVKLTRTGNTFTAEHSADGAAWEQLGIPETIAMAADVYIGLALTSHDTGETCTAQFSDVTITGTVTGQWQSQDIGIASNTADQLYVAVEDSAGKSAVVKHEDPNAVLLDTWQEWNIALKDFTGVNLAAVKKISIGVGDRVNPQPGGAGSLYVDDIRLYIPRCFPKLVKPAADLDNDCVVDYLDLEIMTADWLKSDSIVSTVAPSDANLVAHYTFDGDASDSSGNNHHGIEEGNPTYVDGKLGQAIHLDGLDDYVAITDVNYTSSHAEVSVCAWVRTTDDNGQVASFDRSENWRLEVGGDPSGGPGLVGWDLWTGSQIDTGLAPEFPGNTGRVDDGQWHHLAGVFDNGTLIIYIDGNPKKPYFGGATFGRSTPEGGGRYPRYGFIGAGSEADFPPPIGRQTGAYLEGDVDEVYIYHRALTPAEIAYLADETPGDGELYAPVPSAANMYNEELPLSKSVNIKDFALLADGWLDVQLWPAE